MQGMSEAAKRRITSKAYLNRATQTTDTAMTDLLDDVLIPLEPITEPPPDWNQVEVDDRQMFVPGICPVSGTAGCYHARRRHAELEIQATKQEIEALREDLEGDLKTERQHQLESYLNRCYQSMSRYSKVARSPWQILRDAYAWAEQEAMADAMRW